MLPVIFSIGPITIYSLGFLLAIGFFISAFFNWRRLRDLGIDEEKNIDFLLVYYFTSLLLARLTYALTHYQNFGFDFML